MTKVTVIIVLIVLGLVQIVNYVAGGMAIELRELVQQIEPYYNMLQAYIVFTFVSASFSLLGVIIVFAASFTNLTSNDKIVMVVILAMVGMLQLGLDVNYAMITTYNDEFFGSQGSDQYEDYYTSFKVGMFFSFIAGVPLSILAIILILCDSDTLSISNLPGTATAFK